jgi:tRNA pseudouridine13 synthase
MRVLHVSRHTNKLKPGHLHGNRFCILIRDVEPDAAKRLTPILERLKRDGLPNFYGPQRFGRDGETVQMGMAMLYKAEGKPANLGGLRLPRSPFLRKLALSAAQSALFNHYLGRRMLDGQLRQVLAGDVMAKWPFGGMFLAVDLATEQARFEARETVHAGPIFGKKTFPAAAIAADREAAVLRDADLSPAAFTAHGKLMMGTRRHNLVYFNDLGATLEEAGLRISFSLPAGSYATILLREIMKSAVPAEDEDS